ncbi:carboxypeptidase-like regulatory domain-containing protein [Lacipirellula limnantheis]|nr:carboxypeptidase-like regulatory domain-containing protein [Lacipirellula limnantheis]
MKSFRNDGYRRRVWIASSTSLALSILPMIGCGGESSVTSLSGRVLYEGQPLSNASLMFYPGDGRPVIAPLSNGDYLAQLPPGEYRVTVNLGAELPPGWKEGDPVPPTSRKLPRQFASRLDTPLTATVGPEGKDQTIDFSVP